MTTMEIILVTLVAAICGMGSVLDERQTHRPLVACTLIFRNRYYCRWYP